MADGLWYRGGDQYGAVGMGIIYCVRGLVWTSGALGVLLAEFLDLCVRSVSADDVKGWFAALDRHREIGEVGGKAHNGGGFVYYFLRREFEGVGL